MIAGTSNPSEFKDLERSNWEAKAGDYDEFLGKVTAQATEFLLDAAAVSLGKRVLDVACKLGYVSGSAASYGAEAIGVDFAPSMVAVAKRNFPNAEFREGDGEDLEFPGGSFDAVICPFGLLHMPQPLMSVFTRCGGSFPAGESGFRTGVIDFRNGRIVVDAGSGHGLGLVRVDSHLGLIIRRHGFSSHSDG